MHNAYDHVQERRQSERSRLSAVAALTQGARKIAARLEDVSRGGALLHLEEEVHSDRDPCSVSIAFGRDPEEAISGLVRIVHVAQRLMRVQWEQPLPLEDWVKLRRLMERDFGLLTVVRGRLPMLVWPSSLLRARSVRS
jgi:PilZ domain-containing protein